GAQTIVHVPDELALLDERRGARLVAFVVDVDRSARLEKRRVVDDVAQLARDDVAHLSGVVARALAVEVRLETVTDGFVEEDAAVARREDDLPLPGGAPLA